MVGGEGDLLAFTATDVVGGVGESVSEVVDMVAVELERS